MTEDKLKELSEEILKDAEILDSIIRLRDLQGTQWFLNWQDRLNRISVY